MSWQLVQRIREPGHIDLVYDVHAINVGAVAIILLDPLPGRHGGSARHDRSSVTFNMSLSFYRLILSSMHVTVTKGQRNNAK